MSELEEWVIGSIFPNPENDDEPLFEVRDRRPHRRDREDECDHIRFVLDDRWNEVECAECGEALDPYAALRRYAEWWQEMEYRLRRIRRRRLDLAREELRRLKRLRDVTDEEKAEIEEAMQLADREFQSKEKRDDQMATVQEVVDRTTRLRDERLRRRRQGGEDG